MVAVHFNTRAIAAGHNAKTALALAAAALVLIAVIAGWLAPYLARDTAVEACSGYGGLPSHSFVDTQGGREAAAEHCRLDVPLISISIRNRHYISLQKKRLEALQHGILVTGDDDYVPAHITSGETIYKARVRLKGDWTEHVKSATRWSLRVILSGGNHILGRRRFSLQTFAMRGFDKDPLYAQHLASLGQLTLRYKPVRVQVNGEDWGTMVMEDHFTRELMEFRRRKESVIGRFDEAAMWQHRAQYKDFGPYDNVFTTPYKPFNSRQIRRSPALQRYDRHARSMMAAWQEGRVRLADIVDHRAFADFIIASEVWDGFHTFRWHNMRFYLNPYTMKFEPMPFDNGWGLWHISPAPVQAKATGSQVLAELLESGDFRRVLEQRIPPVLEALQLAPVWSDLERSSAHLIALLEAEGSGKTVSPGVLHHNIEFLASTGIGFFDNPLALPDSPQVEPTGQFHSMVKVSAYGNGVIALSNRMPFAVRVRDIRLVSEYGSRSLLGPDTGFIDLPATPLLGRPTVVEIRAEAIDADATIAVTSENPSTGQQVRDITETVIEYLDAATLANWSPGAVAVLSEPPDYIEVNGNQWSIPRGRWTLERALVIPENTSLTIEGGARIGVRPGGYILGRGALHLKGTAGDPIIIEGENGQSWSGIYLLNVDEGSDWDYAELRDIGPFVAAEFELTGALNFYRSAVSMDHVSVSRVDAEDAINLVQSAFEIDNLSVHTTSSDAIDSDFSSGAVRESAFFGIGGDGIDTSGSNVELADVHLRGVADKAISVGEASELNARDLRLEDVGVGIAVKDYSRAFLDGVSVDGARLAAVMAYTKKPEYGGALLDIRALQVDDSNQQIINQLGSTVLLDGVAVSARPVNIDYYYQQGLMPK